jgi:hypothetical protein
VAARQSFDDRVSSRSPGGLFGLRRNVRTKLTKRTKSPRHLFSQQDDQAIDLIILLSVGRSANYNVCGKHAKRAKSLSCAGCRAVLSFADRRRLLLRKKALSGGVFQVVKTASSRGRTGRTLVRLWFLLFAGAPGGAGMLRTGVIHRFRVGRAQGDGPGLRFGFRNAVSSSWFHSGWLLSPLFHEDDQIFVFPPP